MVQEWAWCSKTTSSGDGESSSDGKRAADSKILAKLDVTGALVPATRSFVLTSSTAAPRPAGKVSSFAPWILDRARDVLSLRRCEAICCSYFRRESI